MDRVGFLETKYWPLSAVELWRYYRELQGLGTGFSSGLGAVAALMAIIVESK